MVRPHKDLIGRSGTVCPFVPGSLERKVLWLAPEQIAERGAPDVVELVSGYKKLLLETQPTDGDDADYNVIVVVFTDLTAGSSSKRKQHLGEILPGGGHRPTPDDPIHTKLRFPLLGRTVETHTRRI